MNDSSASIVITGAAIASGLGLSRQQTWDAILRGECALRPLTTIESPLPPGADGGEALPLPDDFAPHLPREARYLKWTLNDALRDAHLSVPLSSNRRCACLLGTTLHGMRAAGRFLRGGDYALLRDFLAGDILQLAAEGLEISGLAASVCSACSSSLASISLGVALLQSGEADLVIAGGYDAVGEYVYGGFNSLRLVAPGPLRPFARNRLGMKLAEGYGIVILERAVDAAQRGAVPLARILGAAESSDSHHLTQPHPWGDGAARAMNAALAQARLQPRDISLVAAHATGTPDNDAGEFAAFSRVFGDGLPQVPVVAFKSHLGHTLGGAGAVELILSAMALHDQIIPACANVRADEIEFPGLSVATGEPRRAPLHTTLNTSLGFGGANACVILGRPDAVPTSSNPGAGLQSAPTRRDVYITGIGVVFPGMVGNGAFLKRLSSTHDSAWLCPPGTVREEELAGLLNARRVRRMSDYVKLTLAAATLALRDAGISDPGAFAADCAAVLGTMHGSCNFCVDYYTQIVREGLIAANPSLFAEGVPNAGAAQLSLMLSIKGPCQTVIGTRTAGLDALSLAAARIGSGQWERAFVGAGEEDCAVVNEAHRRCGVGSSRGSAPFTAETGFVSGAGAVVMLLESIDSLQQRGGKARGRIVNTASVFGNRAHAARSVEQVLAQLGHPVDIISSACGTWMDGAEAAAIARSSAHSRVTSIYGHIAETFSVTPLAGIAAGLLAGRLPILLGNSVALAQQGGSADDFAVLCTDFSGAVSGARVGRV